MMLKEKNINRGHMESVYSRQFGFENSNMIWKNIFKQKVSDNRVPKLREFTYKVLNNIVPSGVWLNKWKREISDTCGFCKAIETTQHMLFNCDRIKRIWNSISLVLGAQISWKSIVCGWPAYPSSEKLRCINTILAIVAYGIFRINSKCKFDGLNYASVDMKRVVLESLLYYRGIRGALYQSRMLTLLMERVIDILHT